MANFDLLNDRQVSSGMVNDSLSNASGVVNDSLSNASGVVNDNNNNNNDNNESIYIALFQSRTAQSALQSLLP